jgi:hypothetical protein
MPIRKKKKNNHKSKGIPPQNKSWAKTDKQQRQHAIP